MQKADFPANRFRFLQEILNAVTEIWPAERVGVRLGPNGNFNDMGSEDFREIFTYSSRELNKFGLAYLHLVNGLALGSHGFGKPMELNEFRKVFSGPIIGNFGYTFETGETTIQRDEADLIAFGRPFISNPDLVERFRNGWPLAAEAKVNLWYSFEKEGYIDFEFFNPSS